MKKDSKLQYSHRLTFSYRVIVNVTITWKILNKSIKLKTKQKTCS